MDHLHIAAALSENGNAETPLPLHCSTANGYVQEHLAKGREGRAGPWNVDDEAQNIGDVSKACYADNYTYLHNDGELCTMLQGFMLALCMIQRPRFIPGEIVDKRDWGQKTARERLFQPMNEHQSAPIAIFHYICMSTQNIPLPTPASRNILERLIYLPISQSDVLPSQLIYRSLIEKQKLSELHRTKSSA